jgi:FAD/FMN-containing dehydrogenase
LREGITESLAKHTPYKNDISVRVSAMPAFLAEAQSLLGEAYPHFDVVWFGHIGDGNLHINVLKPTELAMQAFVGVRTRHQAAGRTSCTATAAASLPSTASVWSRRNISAARAAPAEIAVMRGIIRQVLDPNGIMNPGKLMD